MKTFDRRRATRTIAAFAAGVIAPVMAAMLVTMFFVIVGDVKIFRVFEFGAIVLIVACLHLVLALPAYLVMVRRGAITRLAASVMGMIIGGGTDPMLDPGHGLVERAAFER